jgi:hypothetical protein
MLWKPYDPGWLVALARETRPAEPWLAAALAKCTLAAEESRAYTYFVDPREANQPGSEWQFDSNVMLKHPVESDLVLDILIGQRVGGIEFLARL